MSAEARTGVVRSRDPCRDVGLYRRRVTLGQDHGIAFFGQGAHFVL